MKTVSALDWFSRNCGKARFLLKVDDDVYVNFNWLLEALQSFDHNTRERMTL